MNCTFQQYLLNVGIRSVEFTYEKEILQQNIPYFKENWKQNISEYKALTFLHFHLNNNDENIST